MVPQSMVYVLSEDGHHHVQQTLRGFRKGLDSKMTCRSSKDVINHVQERDSDLQAFSEGLVSDMGGGAFILELEPHTLPRQQVPLLLLLHAAAAGMLEGLLYQAPVIHLQGHPQGILPSGMHTARLTPGQAMVCVCVCVCVCVKGGGEGGRGSAGGAFKL